MIFNELKNNIESTIIAASCGAIYFLEKYSEAVNGAKKLF